MRRMKILAVAVVASVGIFLSTQAFARSTSDQSYNYQSSQSQINRSDRLSQPFAFRGQSDQGVVVQREDIPNPSYYEQNTPYYEQNTPYHEQAAPRQGSSYYYQNREYDYSGPNATRPYYYGNEPYGKTYRQNEQYRGYDYNTPGYYNSERDREQYNYSAPDANTYEYYGNEPSPNQNGNTGRSLRMENTLRPDASTHPFFYQDSRSSDFRSSHGAPGGHYNPHGILQESPLSPQE